jgi:general stress protein 26
MEHQTGPDAKAKLLELLAESRVGMMATRHDDGTMHARPMAVRHTEFDGHLWYLTDIHSEKVSDLRHHDEVLISYADFDRHQYVSVTGRATLVRDKAAIRKIWSEADRVWFPDGPDDESIVAIRVDVDHAEYWDTRASAMKLAYGYARALLTGEKPKHDGASGHVTF